MTVAHIYTVAFQGIEAREVDVQVHIGDGAGGQNNFSIVGLADKAVAESRERVRAALSAIGLALPYQRVTVNLAPADLPKEGSHYDLPIALGLLAAMGVLPASEMANYVALGELSLDAQVTAVAGVLPAALAASEAQRGLICPAACGPEAVWAGAIEIIATPSLIALVNHVKGVQVLNPPTAKIANDAPNAPDLKDVKGQETAKRALEIAAAGGHNMLMIGPIEFAEVRGIVKILRRAPASRSIGPDMLMIKPNEFRSTLAPTGTAHALQAFRSSITKKLPLRCAKDARGCSRYKSLSCVRSNARRWPKSPLDQFPFQLAA
jgi:Subunit ChlI of Mg-chelatase/Magnesium chelatase, subunit ChlI